MILRYVFSLLFLLPFAGLYSQKAMTFDSARAQGFVFETLDSLYPGALNGQDSTKSIFYQQEEEYLNAWKGMLQSLGNYLHQNGFDFTQPTKGSNRIYFRPDGHIDYYFYKFKPDQLTEEQIARFNTLLQLFIEEYQFTLKASRTFAQCGGFTFMPPAKRD